MKFLIVFLKIFLGMIIIFSLIIGIVWGIIYYAGEGFGIIILFVLTLAVLAAFVALIETKTS